MKAPFLFVYCLLFAGFVAITLPTTGCKTVVTNGVTNTVFDVQKATNIINAALPPLTKLAVGKYPQARTPLADTAFAFNFVANGSDYSPEALNAVLTSSGLTALDNPDIQAVIDSAVAIYKGMYGDVVTQKLDKVKYLVPLLQSIGSSITQGLQ